MADTRSKNLNWNLGTEHTWPRVHAALLMDIRDELQTLNRLLSCRHFIDIPRKLDRAPLAEHQEPSLPEGAAKVIAKELSRHNGAGRAWEKLLPSSQRFYLGQAYDIIDAIEKAKTSAGTDSLPLEASVHASAIAARFFNDLTLFEALRDDIAGAIRAALAKATGSFSPNATTGDGAVGRDHDQSLVSPPVAEEGKP